MGRERCRAGPEPLLTCEPVLAETAFRLCNVGLVLQMVTEQFLTLSFDRNDHVLQLTALAEDLPGSKT